MYELTVEHAFSAAHSIRIGGVAETLHGHDWRVTATIRGSTLDADGLLCDFHTVQGVLADLCAPFHNHTLNALPPFDRTNPTAELVARHLVAGLAERLDPALGPHARVHSVRVTEAIGCAAVAYGTGR
jgi:6-pyruvoyltetrahydropterin/6-carboxytetrahydropterin synthase